MRDGAARRWIALPVASVLVLAASCSAGGGDGSTSGLEEPPATTTSTTAVPTTTTPPTVPESTTTTAPPPPPSPVEHVVVIDPGHNGANGQHPEVINQPVDAGGFQKACNTTGASTDAGQTESAINLEVAFLLRDRLAGGGAEVILTRDSDNGVGPCIDRRGLIAAESGADLLVSLHADGAPSAGHGFHVIHPGLRRGYTDATVEPSRALATQVRDSLVGAGFVPSTYVGDDGLNQRDDLGTLNRAGVPAVMIEAGNLRNPGDAALLSHPDSQTRLADALAAAVLAYLG